MGAPCHFLLTCCADTSLQLQIVLLESLKVLEPESSILIDPLATSSEESIHASSTPQYFSVLVSHWKVQTEQKTPSIFPSTKRDVFHLTFVSSTAP